MRTKERRECRVSALFKVSEIGNVTWTHTARSDTKLREESRNDEEEDEFSYMGNV